MNISLSAAYSRIPEISCKGLCFRECGPIRVAAAEAHNIEVKYGSIPIHDPETKKCSKLIDHRCEIYEDRPFICRIFGAIRSLKCKHGCGPAGGYMREREAFKIFAKIERML